MPEDIAERRAVSDGVGPPARRGIAEVVVARADGIASKPAFRSAFKSRRCLIPADGFYEWQSGPRGKQPYRITLADGSMFALAGLWERWRNPATDESIESCCIVTCDTNELTAKFHDRMPVILPPDNYDLWLDPGFKDVKELSEMLKPYGAALMKAYAVSTRVNTVKNDDSQCAEPLDIPGDQHTLALGFSP